MSVFELAWAFHQYGVANGAGDEKTGGMSDAEFQELSKFIDDTPLRK